MSGLIPTVPDEEVLGSGPAPPESDAPGARPRDRSNASRWLAFLIIVLLLLAIGWGLLELVP